MLRACVIVLAATLAIQSGYARDDGRFANSPLKSWFERLASGRGLCCNFADGFVVEDPNWATLSDVAKPDVHYRVRVNGKWIDVPDDAVITEPNRLGKTMVWPMIGDDGMTIRCFMPGSMS